MGKSKPVLHLICNAHLDPVWQWRWEEGASESLATFRVAVRLLDEHPSFVFCHNEAVLYQWAERLDPALFREIRRLVKAGRWEISGGWFLQPDANLPGTESLIRQIEEGRRYFKETFDAVPRAAYNFDSFGHSGGLPQILRAAGYEMYIHMRPQAGELALPAGLYRWRGVDGTEIPAYRIEVGLYHTEVDNLEEKLEAGAGLALRLDRDVPVFWGLGDHGGGATREDLKRIDAFIARETRVRVVHSTPDRFAKAVRAAAAKAPVHTGDLQRCFPGCYTSLSRLKRAGVENLGLLVQSEALAAAAWWLRGGAYPGENLRGAWQRHLFNDFHDVISGSCIEPAEKDALAIYGASSGKARETRFAASASLVRGAGESPALPVVVVNANPAATRVPVEVEAMISYRPKWSGTWHLRLFDAGGREIPCQEEQPEALLPFNGWRRKVAFLADLPGVGAARYELKLCGGSQPKSGGALEGLNTAPPKEGGSGTPAPQMTSRAIKPPAVKAGAASLEATLAGDTGWIESITAGGANLLAAPAPRALVVRDDADSWGTGVGSWRDVLGEFRSRGAASVVEDGPVRTIVESVETFRRSCIVRRTILYPEWNAVEVRLRIVWNEERRRLKLAFPTALRADSLVCEIPGGAIDRPADGEEHVHGRWCSIEDRALGAAFGIAHNGLHGLDFEDGELRLSVLRSAAYCHERGFRIGNRPVHKFADIGVHEIRLLVTAGEPGEVRRRLSGWADFLAAPPAAFAHMPFGSSTGEGKGDGRPGDKPGSGSLRGAGGGPIVVDGLLTLSAPNVRLLACKRSHDGRALVVRVQEAAGRRTKAILTVAALHGVKRPAFPIPLDLRPFEITALRIERSGLIQGGAWLE